MLDIQCPVWPVTVVVAMVVITCCVHYIQYDERQYNYPPDHYYYHHQRILLQQNKMTFDGVQVPKEKCGFTNYKPCSDDHRKLFGWCRGLGRHRNMLGYCTNCGAPYARACDGDPEFTIICLDSDQSKTTACTAIPLPSSKLYAEAKYCLRMYYDTYIYLLHYYSI